MSKYPIPFGRQLLLERINVGGMAEVFKAKAFGVEGFERIVAIKRILPTLVEDDEFTTMFVDEARIAAQLTHQNIVQIYDLGRHEETFYISMEYVAGRDLRAILDWQKKQRRPMEVSKACFIVSRVSEALEYAHRKRDPAGRDLKIIHRDVTPQNVILSYEGEVKLCDFGIAKAASRVSRTQVGVLKGKFAYMSPEQVRGQPIDRRSDLFALGVIFYEMLTGERLFLGESDYATLEAVRNAVIPPPRQFNPEISPELERVMLRMLTQHPRDRFQWAAEVHEDLLEHIVAQGRPYHSRHLRQWMQDIYAREIEIENAKLESFMQLRLSAEDLEDSDDGPVPAEVVMAMQEQGVVHDPAEAGSVDLPGDPTDHFAIPVGAVEPENQTDNLTYDDGARLAVPVRSATNSPVSDLYGAPALEEGLEAQPDSDAAFVRPADAESSGGGPTMAEERAESDGERTQFDMQMDPALVEGNETLFDDANETVMGDGTFDGDISAAQAELLDRLGEAGALDNSPGVSFAPGDSHTEEGIPELDSGDLELEDPTLHGDETINGALAFDGVGDDTNLSPLVRSDDTDEDAFAATALRAAGLADDDGETFDGDSGTIDEAPPPRFDPEVFRTHNEPPPVPSAPTTPAPSWTPAQTPDPDRPKWRRPASVVHNRGTPRPIIERNHTQRPPEPQVDLPIASPPETTRQGFMTRPRTVMLLAGGVGLLAAILLVVVVSSMQPKSASLRITCEPQEVEVLLDGAFVGGQAPVELQGLPVGPHRVELRAQGYLAYEQTIEIREPKPHQMSVVLERSVQTGSRRPAPDLEPKDDLPMGDGVPEDEPAPE